MSWMHQVWHVFRRDLRRTWMVLALYLVVLALAAARALDWGTAIRPALEPAGVLIIACAFLAVAGVLLVDGTTRADAFWAITPIESSAVAASKLLYVLLLLALCGGVTLAVGAAWDLSVLTSDSGTSALVPVLLLLLLGMALIASAFGSMGGVTAAAGVAFAGWMLLTYGSDDTQRRVAPTVWWTGVCLLAVGSVALIAWRYRTRGTTLVARGTAVGSGVLAMLFPLVAIRAVPGAHRFEPYDPTQSLDSVSVTMPIASMPQCDGAELMVPLEANAPRGWRLGLMKPTLEVTRDDGSVLEIPARTWMQLAGGEGPILPTNLDRRRVKALGGDGDLLRMRTAIIYRVPPSETARTCGHIAQLRARMWLMTSTADEVLRVPLRGTASAASPGYRGSIISQAIQDSAVTLTVRVSAFWPERGTPGDEIGALDFALLNPARGEIVRLRTQSTDAVSSTVALPGFRHGARRLSLELDERRGLGLTDPQSWRTNGVLVAIAPRDVGRGWATLQTTSAK